jgi:acyl carrier protein
MPDVENQVRSFLAEKILFSATGYPYPDDASFLESGVVDSMNVMEIVTFTEKAFGIRVSDHEIVPAHFDSVANVASFVRQKLATAAR